MDKLESQNLPSPSVWVWEAHFCEFHLQGHLWVLSEDQTKICSCFQHGEGETNHFETHPEHSFLPNQGLPSGEIVYQKLTDVGEQK